NMTQLGQGYINIRLTTRYAKGDFWFCPNATSKYGALLTEVEKRSMMSQHRTSYPLYSGYWDGTRVTGPTEPVWGPIGKRINAKASRLGHVKANMVRASEWWEPPVGMGGTDGAQATHVPPHADRRGYFAGGNCLYGDGSVRWGTRIINYM